MSGLYDFPRRSPALAIPRPVWPQDIVAFNQIELDRIRQRLADAKATGANPPTGLMARVRWVWALIEREAPAIIDRAERFFDAPGLQKKEAVIAWLNRVVDLLEAAIDIPVVPAILEGMVWRLVRRRIPDIVQRVFERLAEAGVVNAPEGPGASA